MWVTQFRSGQSFNLDRFSSSGWNKTTTSATDDSTENAQNLNTSTEDGLDNIQMENVQQHPAVEQQKNNTTESPVAIQQEDDDYYYDDWEDGPSAGEFIDLDAIVQPTPINLYRAPVTGLFKLADSNDWVVVEHFYMDHYYFGDLGAGLTAN